MARRKSNPAEELSRPEQPGQLPLIAIVGRPNAGKSTFFNRLSPQRKAVVDNTPGVTRDRNFARSQWYGQAFILVDTGGIDPSENEGIVSRVQEQTQLAIAEADAIIFLFDGREGLNPADTQAVDLLRRSKKPVFFAVNKIDGPKQAAHITDFYALGIEPLYAISAAHGLGVSELLEAVLEWWQETSAQSAQSAWIETENAPENHSSQPALPVAIIGRPNVGKSSLLNRLVGFERSIVDATPGTTRDAIDSLIEWNGRAIRLVDTAGIRRRPRIYEKIEQASVFIALRAIERARVCVVVIDAVEGMTDQEARLIHYAWDRGRGVLLVVNKWDAVPPGGKNISFYEKALRRQSAATLHLPIVFVSALTGARVPTVLPALEQLAQAHALQLPTVQLNRCLKEWTERTPPPAYKGRTPRFYYVSQVSTKPPVIAIYSSAPQGVTKGYARYLENQFRQTFELTGTPLRLSFRSRRKDRPAAEERHAAKTRQPKKTRHTALLRGKKKRG